MKEISRKRVLLDSSCWIEILNEGHLSASCRKELKGLSPNNPPIVPTLVIYEVYRKVTTSISEDQALSVIALLSQNQVVDLTREIALSAADISIQYKLPMADSFVLAHARHENALLVTLDNDFAEIDGVKVLRK